MLSALSTRIALHYQHPSISRILYAQVGVHFKGNKGIRYVQVGKGYWVLEYNEAGLVYFISCLESQYPKDRAI